jgi:hypothetical protein
VDATKQDLTHLVYTHIISKGVFPFSFEQCTQDLRRVQNMLFNFFVPDEIAPWSQKYHCSFVIGNFRYSFTPNDLFNLTLVDERIWSQRFGVNQLRILDFFPLDNWIEKIASLVLSVFRAMVTYKKTEKQSKIYASQCTSTYFYSSLLFPKKHENEAKEFWGIRELFKTQFYKGYFDKVEIDIPLFFDKILRKSKVCHGVIKSIADEFVSLYKEELFGKKRLLLL